MSLWDNIKNWLKRAGTWVKNQFSSWDTYTDTVTNDKTNDSWKQTLNQQIANWTITNNNSTNTTNTTITNSGFDTLREKLNEPSTTINTTTIEKPNSQAIEDKEDEKFLTKVGNWFRDAGQDIKEISSDAYNFINDLGQSMTRNRIIKDEYAQREKVYALWYDPDSKDVYYLDLNEDRWISDFDLGTHEWVKDRFDELYSEAYQEIQRTWNYTEAFQKFYDNAKWLFRIRADDRYWSLRNWIWRRYEMYTQDELDTLAKSWITKNAYKDWYTPSYQEFMDYVAMYEENMATQGELSNILEQYTPNIEEIRLESWTQNDWMSDKRKIALQNIDGILSSMNARNPNAATNARMTYSSYILNDTLWRWYAQVAPIYRAEQEILSRDSSTWSEQDRELLKRADIARQMDKQFASNVNDLFRQIVAYWTDSSWNIVSTPDMFEWWESLNDVLTRWLRELSWEDYRWYSQHQSDLDIIQNFANETLYIYNQDKKWPIKKAWNAIEHFFEPVGSTLWEGWQAIWGLWMDAISWFSLGMISDDLTKSYMDQDSTAFRLLETDDSNIKRTIKKYYLDATEYTPEVLWNLVPDIAMYAVVWPWAATTAVTKVNDIRTAYRVAKAAKWASFLNKVRVITWLAKWKEAIETLWVPASKYWEIINAAKNLSWRAPNQVLKTAAQLIDKTVTEFALWQFMDAQWSAYDTEPYSQASFLMSAIWSWLFDIMPYLTTLATWRKWWNLFWDSIWDLAKYISSSEEAAKNIAAALRKWTKEIWLEDLQAFVKSYWTIASAAEQAYNWLKEEEKQKIWEMTKWLMYSYINQAFGNNSTIGKRVRQILSNKNSNIADVVKYVAKIPWDVKVWPYVSTIKLKNGTRAAIYTTGEGWEYSPILDSAFNWWFDDRVKNWFSQADLDKLSKIDWYSDIEKNKSKWFDSVDLEDKWTTYFLNKAWLKHFGLKAESVTLESLWITLKEAENTKEALNQIKWVDWVKISDTTIDNIAETWAYDEITSKVKEVLWC